MDNFSITQNGKPLAESLYTIDMENRVFSSKESNLVLDFGGWIECTFNTGSYCIFSTGDDCTFDTGWACTFNTGGECTFNTRHNCTFDTGGNCTFDTGHDCIFSLYNIDSCTFKSYDGYSTILDRTDKQAYKLTKEFVKLQKVVNG